MEVVLQEEQVILRVPTDVADLVRDAVKSGVGLDLVPLGGCWAIWARLCHPL